MVGLLLPALLAFPYSFSAAPNESGQPSGERVESVELLRFEVFRGTADDNIAAAIESNLNTAFEQAGFKVVSEGATVRVRGYYSRTKAGNLLLYGQLYSARNNRLVDAYNEIAEVPDLADVQLPPEDLRIPDDKILKQFASRIAARLRSNPYLRERTRNIERYVSGSAISSKVALNQDESTARRRQSEDVFRLLEDQEVVTPSRARTRVREAPAAVYVITARQIEERGYKTLVDALHDVPGFDIIHVYGIFPELIHQRGLVGNNQRTLLYIDGILDNNLTENAVLAGSIRYPLFNVERIEIVSGPASAVYGANAFNGVINIITKEGGKDPGGQAGATYGGYESSFRNQGESIFLASRGNAGKTLSYSASAYYLKSAGPNFGGIQRLEKPVKNSEEAVLRRNDALYGVESQLCGGQCQADGSSRGYFWSPLFNVAYEETYNITAGFRAGGFRFETIHWQYYQGDGTFANGTQQIDAKQRGLETGEFDARNSARLLGVLNGIASPQGFSGSYWNFRNNSAAIGYDFDLSSKITSETEFVARHTEILSSSHEEVPNKPGPDAHYRPGDTTQFSSYSRPDYSYEFEQRLSWDLGKNQLSAGTEWIYTSIPRGYGATERITFANYALYLEDVYRMRADVALTVGYRYDMNTDYGDSHTPRASVVYTPSDRLTFKFLAAGGFRAPTGWELFNATAQRRENRDLKPERLRAAEVGASWRIARPYYVSMQVYYNDISDLLLEVETAEPNPNIPGTNFNQNRNVGRAIIQGTEVQGDLVLNRKWTAFTHYTYSQGEYIDLPDPVTLSASPSTKGRPGDDPLTDGLIGLYKTVRMAQPQLTEFLESATGNEFSPYEGPMPNIARHKGGLGTVYRPLGGLSLHLRFYYVGVRRTIATNPEPTLPAYTFWTANVRWENLGLEGLILEVLARNLTNDLHFDPGLRTATGGYFPSRHPLEKRNIWITLSYRW